jgi:hypothetical protein
MNDLTKEEIKILLLEWEKICLEHDKLMVTLSSIGIVPDGSFSDVLYKSNNKYMEFLAEKIGAEDWLEWYCWENDMGKKKFKASIGGGKEKSIKNIEDLTNLIIKYRNIKISMKG